MPDISVIPPNYLGNLFLVFVRVGAMLMTAPVVSGRTVPAILKIGLSLLVAFLLVPMNHLAEVSFQWASLSVLLVKEIGVGVVVGLVANLTFNAVQLAGQYVGLQMGFTLANIIDPLFGQNLPVLDQLYTVLAGLIFLAIDGPQMLILAVQQTLDIVPVGSSFEVNGPMVNQLAVLTSGVFVASLRLVFPVIAALLLADIALGLVSRTVPQMNILVVGLPLKIILGFVLIIITLPAASSVLSGLFRSSVVDITNLLRLAA